MGETRPIESECPACGAPVWFEFTRRSIEPEPPIARCDKCLVHVALRDDAISEVALEMLTEKQGFLVHTPQYEGRVPRADGGGLEFAMPGFCAICGSPDATQRRQVVIYRDGRDVNMEVWQQVRYYGTGSRGRGLGTSSVPRDISGRDFSKLQVPVCAKHVSPTSEPSPLQTDDYGLMVFASYRFYKAFLVANSVQPPGTEGLPAARIRG